MFNVSQFLEKFKVLGLGEIMIKEAFIDSLRKCIGVEITKKDIEWRNEVLYLKANPILKNQIYIKKAYIMECLNEKLKTKVKDIR